MNNLDKVRRLKQYLVTWLCTARRAPVWITPSDQPAYRPYIVMVMEEETEIIRQSHFEEAQPTPDVVWEVLLQAMLHRARGILGGQGKQGRPVRIFIDDAALVEALSPRLAEIGVRCSYRASLPAIDTALAELERDISKRDSLPGLLSVPGVTEPLARELFAAAADYYRQAPWRWMNNLWPIEVCYPPDTPPRYAVVLGSGGETFGLSLYKSAYDLYLMYNKRSNDFTPVPVISVILEQAMLLPFADLDAIEEFGWPVAGEKAYPLAVRLTPENPWGSRPSATEIAWLAAAMRVVPDFVVEWLHADRGYPQPAEAVYTLPGVHAGQEIVLRYPAVAFILESAIEEYIEGWYWDESSHRFAREMASFFFQFIDYLAETGLAESTLRKHGNNCWCIGYLICHYSHHKTFSPDIFAGVPLYLTEFKREFSDSPSAVNSYQTTWRKLARYVRSRK